MSSKTILSALAAVAAIAIVAAAQDPTFEYPAAKHVGFDVPKDSLFQGSASSGSVSVSFRNATAREVLDWLKNEGVNFVVDDGQINKDGRVSLNVVNKPLQTVMDALARAWGGHWEKKNDIWIFRKGVDFFSSSGDLAGTPAPNTAYAPYLQNRLKSDGAIVAKIDNLDQVLRIQGDLGKERSEALTKALQKDDSKSWEEFAKAWQKWAQEYEKNFREFEKNFKGKDFDFKMNVKMLEEMQKHAQDMAKAGEKMRSQTLPPGSHGFTWDGKDFKPLDDKQWQEMQKHFEEMGKGAHGLTWDGKDLKPFDDKKLLQEMQKRNEEMTKKSADMAKRSADMARKMAEEAKKNQRIYFNDGKGYKVKTYTWDGKDFKSFGDQKGKVEYHVVPPGNQEGRIRFYKGPDVTTGLSTHNLKAIYDSLTPTQDEKLKRLGYINYRDLNSNQRKLLGVITDESWSITYKTDKANLTIKSDR